MIRVSILQPFRKSRAGLVPIGGVDGVKGVESQTILLREGCVRQESGEEWRDRGAGIGCAARAWIDLECVGWLDGSGTLESLEECHRQR